MIYVDSSVLLELYLAQPGAAAARAVLALPGAKASSWLLAVEVPVVLRRLLGSRPGDRRLLAAALAAFDGDVRALHLVDALPEVAARVRADARLAGCRALDAVHLVTALLLREETGSPVALATFDEAQRRLATTLTLGLVAP